MYMYVRMYTMYVHTCINIRTLMTCYDLPKVSVIESTTISLSLSPSFPLSLLPPSSLSLCLCFSPSLSLSLSHTHTHTLRTMATQPASSKKAYLNSTIFSHLFPPFWSLPKRPEGLPCLPRLGNCLTCPLLCRVLLHFLCCIIWCLLMPSL